MALVLYQRALDGKKKVLGNAHPNTLTANMSVCFKMQGDYGKALCGYKRALVVEQDLKSPRRRAACWSLPTLIRPYYSQCPPVALANKR